MAVSVADVDQGMVIMVDHQQAPCADEHACLLRDERYRDIPLTSHYIIVESPSRTTELRFSKHAKALDSFEVQSSVSVATALSDSCETMRVASCETAATSSTTTVIEGAAGHSDIPPQLDTSAIPSEAFMTEVTQQPSEATVASEVGRTAAVIDGGFLLTFQQQQTKKQTSNSDLQQKFDSQYQTDFDATPGGGGVNRGETVSSAESNLNQEPNYNQAFSDTAAKSDCSLHLVITAKSESTATVPDSDSLQISHAQPKQVAEKRTNDGTDVVTAESGEVTTAISPLLSGVKRHHHHHIHHHHHHHHHRHAKPPADGDLEREITGERDGSSIGPDLVSANSEPTKSVEALDSQAKIEVSNPAAKAAAVSDQSIAQQQEATLQQEATTIQQQEITLQQEATIVQLQEATLQQEATTIQQQEITLQQEATTVQQQETTLQQEATTTHQQEAPYLTVPMRLSLRVRPMATGSLMVVDDVMVDDESRQQIIDSLSGGQLQMTLHVDVDGARSDQPVQFRVGHDTRCLSHFYHSITADQMRNCSVSRNDGQKQDTPQMTDYFFILLF